MQAFLVLVCIVLLLLEGWAFKAYLGQQQDPGTAVWTTPDSLGDTAGGAAGSGKEAAGKHAGILTAGLLGAAKRTVAASNARAPQQADARLEAAELQVKTLLAQQLAAQEAHKAESAAAAARVAELTAALERSEGLVQRLNDEKDEFSSMQCHGSGAAAPGPTAASGSVSSVREVKELGSRWGLLGSAGDVEEEPFDKCSWQVSALQYRCACGEGAAGVGVRLCWCLCLRPRDQ